MEKKRKNLTSQNKKYSKVLPCVFLIISLVLILLPLQMPVNSLRLILSYIFIPQLRAAHSIKQYVSGVNETVADLLTVADENASLKEEIALLKIENSRLENLENENKRLADALNLTSQGKWQGVWARVAYREPSRQGSVIIDKGANDGVELRSPALAIQAGKAGLAGNVIEVTANTAKVLLLNDEDFSAAARIGDLFLEGLVSGNGAKGIDLKYIPLESEIRQGDKIYTSSSGALFPDGILIGEIVNPGYDAGKSFDTYLKPQVKPVIDGGSIKELFIMPALKQSIKEQDK